MIAARPRGRDQNPAYSAPPFIALPGSTFPRRRNGGTLLNWGRSAGGTAMKSAAAVAIALLLSSAASAQDDERVRRIVERIEKEIRESHERTREEIRAIIRAEIQKSQGKPAPEGKPSRKVYLGISADDLTEADRQALGSASGIKVS